MHVSYYGSLYGTHKLINHQVYKVDEIRTVYLETSISPAVKIVSKSKPGTC
jgi:hypothetical protein